jgi:hypothetical protein
MRMIAILGIAAAGFLAPAGAEAARWCHTGAQAQGCTFRTQAQCLRTARREGGDCRVQVAARRPAQVERHVPAGYSGMAPGQVYPNRPYWAAPNECFTDDGGGRFRPCSAGGDGGGGLQ